MILTVELDEATSLELQALHALSQARREACGLPDVTVSEVAMTLLHTAIIDQLCKYGLPFADGPTPDRSAEIEAVVDRDRYDEARDEVAEMRA